MDLVTLDTDIIHLTTAAMGVTILIPIKFFKLK